MKLYRFVVDREVFASELDRLNGFDQLRFEPQHFIVAGIYPNPALQRDPERPAVDRVGANLDRLVWALNKMHLPSRLAAQLAHPFAAKIEAVRKRRMENQRHRWRSAGRGVGRKGFGIGAAVAKFFQNKSTEVVLPH